MGAHTDILFSVITPSLNCAAYILRNIDSVRSQGFGSQNLEHWIIDGGSTDGTLEILASTPGVKWISEPDHGLSDAVNKGILRSRGSWIAWLNADDQLHPDALKTVLEYAGRYPDIRIFCGDEIILRYDGSQEQIVRGWPYTFDDLLAKRPAINQASTVVHRNVVERIGLLDVTIRDAMDYEWLVRATRDFKCVYIPRILSVYQRRPGSIMDAHMADFFRTFRAVRRRYGRSRFEYLEWLTIYYLATEPLRRIRWLRLTVRRIRQWLGCEPLHPC